MEYLFMVVNPITVVAVIWLLLKYDVRRMTTK